MEITIGETKFSASNQFNTVDDVMNTIHKCFINRTSNKNFDYYLSSILQSKKGELYPDVDIIRNLSTNQLKDCIISIINDNIYQIENDKRLVLLNCIYNPIKHKIKIAIDGLCHYELEAYIKKSNTFLEELKICYESDIQFVKENKIEILRRLRISLENYQPISKEEKAERVKKYNKEYYLKKKAEKPPTPPKEKPIPLTPEQLKANRIKYNKKYYEKKSKKQDIQGSNLVECK